MNEATVIQAIMDQYNIPRDVAAAVAKEAVARADSRKKLKSVLMDRRKVGYYDWLQSEDSEPEMNWNYHYVKHICKYIQAMIDGDLYQVIFNLPPRLGKTSLITKRLPVYWMERNPADGILLGAYSIELAINFSNFSRKLYAARNPGEVYSEAQREWTNVHGGFLKPVGVGVGVTGRGGELCIIDDPVKSIEEALSKAYMDRLWDWWTYDMKTRRNKMDKTPTAIVMTRWTDEDLTGRIRNSAGAKDWTFVSIPAIAEEDDPLGRAVGESISPARMPIDSLHAYMEEDPVMFSGLFQQKTIQLSSASIKVDKLSFVDEVPLAAHRVRAWDMAATKGAGDFTVGLLMAVDDEGFVYVEDVVRGQYDEEDIGPLIKLTAELDWQMYGNSDTYIMQTWLEQEPGSSGKIVVNSFIRDELQGFDAYAERPSTNKTARARPFVAQVNAGNVRLKRAPWNAAYINELKVIVLGIDNKRDDQMDGSSEAYTKLVTERKRLTVA